MYNNKYNNDTNTCIFHSGLQEKFLKETFENLSFTPVVGADKFRAGLESLEEALEGPQHGQSPRQSLSARFLSKNVNNRYTWALLCLLSKKGNA